MKKILSQIKKINFPKILDFVIFNISAFLICFIILKFFLKNKLTTIIISFITIIMLNIIFFIIQKKKFKKNNIKKEQQKEIENCFLSLLSSSDNELNIFFTKVFKDNNPNKTDFSNIILCKDMSGLAFYFEFKILSFETALKIINNAKKIGIDKLLLFCYSINSKDRLFLESLNEISVKCVEKEELYYNYFQKNNIYPSKTFSIKSTQKLKIKQLISISLERKKTKRYFITGLFVFFCSLIVKYNTYYLIMSFVLFLLSLLSLTSKKQPKL